MIETTKQIRKHELPDTEIVPEEGLEPVTNEELTEQKTDLQGLELQLATIQRQIEDAKKPKSKEAKQISEELMEKISDAVDITQMKVEEIETSLKLLKEIKNSQNKNTTFILVTMILSAIVGIMVFLHV